MARIIGKRGKKARYLNADLGTFSPEVSLEKKLKWGKAPGQHGASRRGRVSDYGTMLRAKQKLRWIYGVMEKQFRRFFDLAAKEKGSTGANLIRLLERRLDNVVYRMGFAITRAEARQLVSHRLIQVNGKIVNIASFLVSEGDMIEVKEKSKKQLRIQSALEYTQQFGFPDWVEVDSKNVLGKFKRIPHREEVQIDLNENLVVEYYSG